MNQHIVENVGDLEFLGEKKNFVQWLFLVLLNIQGPFVLCYSECTYIPAQLSDTYLIRILLDFCPILDWILLNI